MVLAEDVLDSLRQSEGLAGAVGPDDEDRRQGNGDGCGDGQDGLFLLSIQARIQLLVPLPEDRAGNDKLELGGGLILENCLRTFSDYRYCVKHLTPVELMGTF